jgi:hypothetical protein
MTLLFEANASRPAKHRRVLHIARVMGVLMVINAANTSNAEACDLQCGVFNNACYWDTRSIPVWALTQGTGAHILQDVANGAFTASEWGKHDSAGVGYISRGIWSKHQFLFWWPYSLEPRKRSITIRGEPFICDESIAQSNSTTYWPTSELSESIIQFRHNEEDENTGICGPVAWEASSQSEKDIINTLVHELGHSIGIAHPSDCGDSPEGSPRFGGVGDRNRSGLRAGISGERRGFSRHDAPPHDVAPGREPA